MIYHGNIASYTSNLNNDTFAGDEKPGKSLAHLHHGKYVDLEDFSDFVDVDIHSWRSIVGAGVVDKVVEPTASDLLNFFVQSQNGIVFVKVQSKSCNVPMRLTKPLQVAFSARSCDDFQTSAGKLESESSTDSTAASGQANAD